MNLRQLEYFRILAEELNFTRAAERLHMAQPPLSRQVKLLEDHLGAPLFMRTRRSVRLTPEGEYLKKEIGHTFHHLDHIKAGVRQIHNGDSGVISIGYVGAAMHSVLPGILKDISVHYPEVNIHLHELDNLQQVESLRKGAIDLGFLRSRLNDPGLHVTPVVKEGFVLVTPRRIKLKSARTEDLRSISPLPLICFPMSCAPDMVKSIYYLLHQLQLNPKNIHESSQIHSIVRIVESGIGYAILPASIKDTYKPGIQTLDLSRFGERAFLYACNNPERSSALTRNILKLVRPMT